MAEALSVTHRRGQARDRPHRPAARRAVVGLCRRWRRRRPQRRHARGGDRAAAAGHDRHAASGLDDRLLRGDPRASPSCSASSPPTSRSAPTTSTSRTSTTKGHRPPRPLGGRLGVEPAAGDAHGVAERGRPLPHRPPRRVAHAEPAGRPPAARRPRVVRAGVGVGRRPGGRPRRRRPLRQHRRRAAARARHDAPGAAPAHRRAADRRAPDRMGPGDGDVRRLLQAGFPRASSTSSTATSCPTRSNDIAKICVVDRHHASGTAGIGFVRGFGLRRGAIAASTNCDNQNVVVVGTTDDDIQPRPGGDGGDGRRLRRRARRRGARRGAAARRRHHVRPAVGGGAGAEPGRERGRRWSRLRDPRARS